MNEDELKELLGSQIYDQTKEIVQKARRDGRSPDEIKALVRKYFEEHTPYIWNLIGNLQMYILPPRPKA